jgi:hypothetical protein
MLVDQTNHNRLAELTNARLRAAAVADRYIPRTHNEPPVPISNDDFESFDALERAAIAAESAGPDDDGELTYQTPPVIDPDKQLKGAQEAFDELNTFLTATPVIQAAAEAKAGADWKHRTSIALKLLNDERDAKVRPLNDQVDAINERYNKKTRNPLKALFDELCKRLDGYRKAEEDRREAIAAAARAAAEEAARVAQAAAAELEDAVDTAAQGVETDVGALTQTLDEAARTAAALARQAAVAERDSKVRISSVMGPAVSAQTYRELIIADVEGAILAIRAMGLTERIADAICLEAKAFRATWGELPEGVSENKERRI